MSCALLGPTMCSESRAGRGRLVRQLLEVSPRDPSVWGSRDRFDRGERGGEPDPGAESDAPGSHRSVAGRAQRSSVLITVVRRALAQLGVGVLFGMPIARWMFLELEAGSPYEASMVALILGVSVVVVIGLLACTAPTLRALRIMPTEALREGG